MHDTPTTEPTPARADVLRDRVLELLAESLDDVSREDTPSGVGMYVVNVESFANAANALDQIVARQIPATPAPAINVERLCTDVWHATQDAGATTATGDAAVAAIRKVLSP